MLQAGTAVAGPGERLKLQNLGFSAAEATAKSLCTPCAGGGNADHLWKPTVADIPPISIYQDKQLCTCAWLLSLQKPFPTRWCPALASGQHRDTMGDRRGGIVSGGAVCGAPHGMRVPTVSTKPSRASVTEMPLFLHRAGGWRTRGFPHHLATPPPSTHFVTLLDFGVA